MSGNKGEPQKKVTDNYRENWEKIFNNSEKNKTDNEVVELEITDSGC